MSNQTIKKILPAFHKDEVELLYGMPALDKSFFKPTIDDPINQCVKAVENYRQRPLTFWKYELGIPTDVWKEDKPPVDKKYRRLPLWSKQREIVQALVKYKKVAVKSGHGLGKSFIAAGITLYLHYAFKALGVTTAPTYRQVRRVLWGEIHNLYNSSPRKFGSKLTQTSLESGDKWFVEGFSVRDPSAAITGFHEENIFVIIDEAGGVVQEIYDSMEGILTSEGSYVLLIGNPLDSASAFADAFRPDNNEYHKITMSCYDCPNVRHGQNIYTKLCSHDWPDKMKKKWGINSNLFRVRVLGEFPEESMRTLIPVKYIDQALEEYKSYMMETPKRKERVVSLGVDVARTGADSTIIGIRYWNEELKQYRFEILSTTEKQRVDQTSDLVIALYDQYVPNKSELVPINVDDIGLGGGVTDNLTRAQYPVNGINVAESPDPWEEFEENFLNKRAQYYWQVRKLMQDRELVFDDEDLAYELSKIDMEITGKDRIKIEEKERVRKKLQGKSPDRADCLMLTCSKDVFGMGQESLILWL